MQEITQIGRWIMGGGNGQEHAISLPEGVH